jgi:hypothetical protein
MATTIQDKELEFVGSAQNLKTPSKSEGIQD